MVDYRYGILTYRLEVGGSQLYRPKTYILSHGFSPAGPLIRIQTRHSWRSPLDMGYSFRAARGAIQVKQIRIN